MPGKHSNGHDRMYLHYPIFSPLSVLFANFFLVPVYLPVCLRIIMDLHSRVPKKNTSHGNEVLPQGTTHLIQRPCYQRRCPCQDPKGDWITQRPLEGRKERQTAVVWSCFPFIRSGQNHPARHSERGMKADGGRGGKTTSGTGQAWSPRSPGGQ